jgi:hypothetical protein
MGSERHIEGNTKYYTINYVNIQIIEGLLL